MLSPSPDTPDIANRVWHHAIGELRQRLNPARRLRSNPRVVKRKYTGWHVKRSRHYNRPQPTRSGSHAITLTN